MTEARRLRIEGLVQGVGFRYHATRAAQHFGIVGWVRNRRDGSVEAEIAGDAEAIAAMIDWCRRGPPAAQVTHVVVEQVEETPTFDGFVQRETG